MYHGNMMVFIEVLWSTMYIPWYMNMVINLIPWYRLSTFL